MKFNFKKVFAATERQVICMERMGINFRHDITKEDASKKIKRCIENPRRAKRYAPRYYSPPSDFFYFGDERYHHVPNFGEMPEEF